MGQIQERFAFFVEKSRFKKSEVDRKLGISNGFTGKIVQGKSSFSVDILEKIINTFTELNPLWLVTGKGDVYIDSDLPDKLDIDLLIEQKVKEALSKQLEKAS